MLRFLRDCRARHSELWNMYILKIIKFHNRTYIINVFCHPFEYILFKPHTVAQNSPSPNMHAKHRQPDVLHHTPINTRRDRSQQQRSPINQWVIEESRCARARTRAARRNNGEDGTVLRAENSPCTAAAAACAFG